MRRRRFFGWSASSPFSKRTASSTYSLVGLPARRFHGAQRATSDLDICPAWDRENLERLTAALKSLGAHLKGFGHEPDAQGIQNMEVTNWRTASGDIDILLGIPDKSQY